ncbi:MAG: glycoside hydrolase family 31 protein [Bacteroidales bacterium]|nr:glycoside hydrolase family 31 protein [Bacteroidales bacterium]
MYIRTLLLPLLLVWGVIGQAQTMQKTSNGVKTVANGDNVTITFFSNSIVRITKSESPNPELSQAPVVIMEPKALEVKVAQENGNLRVSSSEITANLNLNTGAVCIEDNSGNTFITEKDYGTQIVPAIYNDVNSHAVKQAFRLFPDEKVYGLGQQQTGQFCQRNRRISLWQDNMSISMPYFYSTRGYGLLWNNASPTVWSDSKNETSFESDMGSAVDYFVIAGGNADKVLANLRELTGHAPMLPLWNFGFWQSKERYFSQDETVGVLRKYRELRVPIDCVVQDWQYWGIGDEVWNGVTWASDRYPDPTGMMNEIHAMNGHCIASVWPSFGKETAIYKEMNSHGWMFSFKTFPEGEFARVFDVFNPDARNLYWDYMNKNMFSVGLDGWWLDATEPEMRNPNEAYKEKTYLGLFRKNANAFPLFTVNDVYDKQRKTSSAKRVTILTRSAYLGQQRTGAISWSGDVWSKWDVMERQIPAALNFSLCGNPNWNTDIGGFFSNDFKGGYENPEFREMTVRWTQFGVFMTIMRSHGTTTPREIWRFGEPGTWAYDAIAKAIRLRYSLLPYIYSTAWQVSKYDDTFMRPFLMDFPNDKKAVDESHEYMFGRAFLVAPVTTAMYVDKDGNYNANAEAMKEVYLPAGTDWYDYFTSQREAGGQTIKRHVAIDEMPLYVKAGSIVPIGPDVQYTSEKPWNNLTLNIYPGADGDFTLYEDEGDNYNYEQGECTEIAMHWNDKTQSLTIKPRVGSFKGMLKSRTFIVNVVGGKSKKVSYNGKQTVVKM